MNQTPALNSSELNTLHNIRGVDLFRIFIIASVALGLLLNILALVSFTNVKKSGHAVCVMGLTSGNISSCFSVLLLFPFVVLKTYSMLASLLLTNLLASYMVSIMNILCISVGRLVAVALPLRYSKLFSVKRMTVTVVSLWVSSFVIHAIIALTVIDIFTSADIGHAMSVKFRPFLLTYGSVGLFATVIVYGSIVVCLLRKHLASSNTVNVVSVHASTIELDNLSNQPASRSNSSSPTKPSPSRHLLVFQGTRTNAASRPKGVSHLTTKRAVAKLGTLLLVHVTSGTISLVSSGMMGDNLMSNPHTFGLTVFTMSVSSIFDSVYYVATFLDLRNGLKKCLGLLFAHKQ